MNGTEKSKSTSEPPVTTSAVPRTCNAPGCKRVLVHNNRTGYCADHSSLAKRRGHPTNGHGPTLVSKPNGKANGADIGKANHNGNGAGKTHAHENSHALAIEETVNLVFSRLPLEEKAEMISLWLRTG